MDLQTGLALAALGVAVGGPVLVWLVKIEHRITRMETMLIERLPPRGGVGVS